MPVRSVPGMGLSDLDRGILAIEDARWTYGGRKVAAIAQLGITDVQFAARLRELARDRDAALAYPLLVRRLQRRLDAAASQRRPRRGLLV